MNATEMRAKLEAATTAEALGALYAEIVGYDPFADDPAISASEVHDTLTGLIEEIDE